MTARSPSTGHSGPAAIERDCSGGASSSPCNPATPRVLSLSPSAAGIEVKPLPDTGIDEARSMVATDELRELLSRASAQFEQLQQLLTHADEQQADARETSTQLHERLRLGARMLQAFQAQINRIEAEMARAQELRARLEKTSEAAHGRIEAATTNAAERIERTARQALAALEDRTKMLEARLRTIEEDRSACAAAAAFERHEPAAPPDTGTISELAQSMRTLAARVEEMAAIQPPRPETAPPLRLQKWAEHG